jgi:ATP-dependent DNA ligase
VSYQPKQIEPAAADRIDESDAPWAVSIAERKEDGWRSLIHLDHDAPRMFITGRNRVDKGEGPFAEWGANVPHLAPDAAGMKELLGLTIIDGEIITPPGVPRRLLAGVLGTENPERIAKWKAEHGLPIFHAFDVLFVDGEDVRDRPLSDRLDVLSDLLATVYAGHPFVKEVKRVIVNTRGFYQKLIDSGEEGVILKDLSKHYDASKAWFKVKRKHDVDVFVTGFTDAKEGKTGKFKGLIGAIECAVRRPCTRGGCTACDGWEVVQVAQVSGFSDEMRRSISADKSAFLGRVLTIRAQELAKDKLAHPRFKEWRPDLDPRACTWDKMIADLAANKGRA